MCKRSFLGSKLYDKLRTTWRATVFTAQKNRRSKLQPTAFTPSLEAFDGQPRKARNTGINQRIHAYLPKGLYPSVGEEDPDNHHQSHAHKAARHGHAPVTPSKNTSVLGIYDGRFGGCYGHTRRRLFSPAAFHGGGEHPMIIMLVIL